MDGEANGGAKREENECSLPFRHGLLHPCISVAPLCGSEGDEMPAPMEWIINVKICFSTELNKLSMIWLSERLLAWVREADGSRGAGKFSQGNRLVNVIDSRVIVIKEDWARLESRDWLLGGSLDLTTRLSRVTPVQSTEWRRTLECTQKARLYLNSSNFESPEFRVKIDCIFFWGGGRDNQLSETVCPPGSPVAFCCNGTRVAGLFYLSYHWLISPIRPLSVTRSFNSRLMGKWMELCHQACFTITHRCQQTNCTSTLSV